MASKTTLRRLCKSVLRNGDICPNYAGGPFYEHFCYLHTSKARIQPDPETCGVCFDDMPVEYRTSCCKNVFCRKCLTKHGKAGGKACPSCRAPMGLDAESIEYAWQNLRYRALKFGKRVKEAPYLASKDALSKHILTLMDKQKEDALAEARRAYDEEVKSIEETYTHYNAAWINNTDNYRDDFWKDAEYVRHTVSNIALLRSSRFPSKLLADAGIQMITDATETLDMVLESEDIMGLEEAVDEQMNDLVDAIRSRLQEGDEEDEEDEDWEDVDE